MMQQKSINVILIILLIIALAFSLMLLCNGCRSISKSRIEYFQSGQVSAREYSEETGFHFFSDGVGKSFSPSLEIQGISF